MPETSVAASIIIDLVHQLEGRGIASAELCRRARIDPAILSRPHDRLPGSGAERVWAAAETLTGDPLLGLHVAERFRTGAISILGYVVLNCPTAGAALERLGRFARLLNDGMRVRLDREDGLAIVRFEAIEGSANALRLAGRHPFESTLAGTLLTLRSLTGAATVPVQAWFRHPAGGDLAEYDRIFGTRVRFGMPEHRLAFREAELERRIPAADPSLLALFDRHAVGRLDELDRLGGTSQRVSRLLGARLTGAVPAVGAIARELAMSARQLQRKLREEDTSYQQLLDAARRELALAQLRVPGVTAAEVALLLGYAEAGAFTRAFRRWTGTTPGAWATNADA
ncbi:MAG: AraC family transcriptional regulator [Gemmatimonadales bacterium]|nr:AraC family transcriptional regulator [Gemmatimonadales bacterium]